MAWEKTHINSVTNVSKAQIWKVWTDINQWHTWDNDIEYAKLDQPFAVGSQFTLKPKGGPKVKIEIIKVESGQAFTDMTKFPLAKMYSLHEMKENKDGLEVSHTIKVEGPLSFLWKKLVIEKIAAGLEEQAIRMIEKARSI